MFTPMVRIFDQLKDAEAARAALMEAGFSPDRLQLTALQDEAGPQQGNFVSGDGHSTADNAVGEYDQNFRSTKYRGSNMLMIAAKDEAEQRWVAELVAPFHPVDIEARTAAARA